MVLLAVCANCLAVLSDSRIACESCCAKLIGPQENTHNANGKASQNQKIGPLPSSGCRPLPIHDALHTMDLDDDRDDHLGEFQAPWRRSETEQFCADWDGRWRSPWDGIWVVRRRHLLLLQGKRRAFVGPLSLHWWRAVTVSTPAALELELRAVLHLSRRGRLRMGWENIKDGGALRAV